MAERQARYRFLRSGGHAPAMHGCYAMITNKRKDARRDIKCLGVIVNIDGSIVGQCTTANVSATGAKITLPGPMQVAEEFILVLSKKAQVRRRCKIAWRSEKHIGVRFVSRPEASAKS